MFLCTSETVNSAVVFQAVSVSLSNMLLYGVGRRQKEILCSVWVQYRVDLVQILKCPAPVCLGCICSAMCSGLSDG